MENFEKKIFNLVKSEFNLNVYGSNGCGKSTTLTKIFEKKRLLSTNHIYLKLHNFIGKEILKFKISFLSSVVINLIFK